MRVIEGNGPSGRTSCHVSMMALAVASVLAFSPDVVAQTAASPEVEALLKQRDDAIAKLTRRLEQLERRLAAAERGKKTNGNGAADPAKPDAQPLANAPVAAPVPPASTPPAAAATAGAQPKQEPGAISVDPLAAERALERTLVETGALLLEPGQAEAQLSMSFQRLDRSASALSVDGAGTPNGTVDQRLQRNRLIFDVDLRFGLPFDSQLELSVPYNFVDQGFTTSATFNPVRSSSDTGSAFGDVSIGFAKTLARQDGWLPDLVGRLTWDTKTGESSDNDVPLPAGQNEVRAEISAFRRADPLAFVVNLNYQHAFEDDDVKFGDQIGVAFGAILAASPTSSLRATFETVLVDDFEVNGERREGTDQLLASLNLGASMLLIPRVLFDVTGSLGLTEDAPDFTVRASVSYRFDTPFR